MRISFHSMWRLKKSSISVKTLKSIHVGCKLKLFKTVERAMKKGHKSLHTTVELFSRSITGCMVLLSKQLKQQLQSLRTGTLYHWM